ncbi:MAG: DeoR family transcriptional regulator [Patescibacteria group bacterium]
MDYKKDIKDTGLVSRESSNGMVTFGVTLSKKCERLATAVYLVTNFLSDTEPLKSRLRTLSIDFVRDASFVRYGGQTTEANVLDALRTNIGETLSLLELAFIAGLVSEMNFTILKREFVSLRDSIDIKKASRESRTDTILGDNFFGASESVSHPVFRIQRSGLTGTPEDPTFMHPVSASTPSSKGHPIGQTTTTMSDRNTKGHTPPASSLSTLNFRLSTGVAPTPRATTDIAKESRRTRILKLIKDNREVSIKDIVSHFPDLSEKTIQRELVSMSDSGVLKKSGERRWSRYALA